MANDPSLPPARLEVLMKKFVPVDGGKPFRHTSVFVDGEVGLTGSFTESLVKAALSAAGIGEGSIVTTPVEEHASPEPDTTPRVNITIGEQEYRLFEGYVRAQKSQGRRVG